MRARGGHAHGHLAPPDRVRVRGLIPFSNTTTQTGAHGSKCAPGEPLCAASSPGGPGLEAAEARIRAAASWPTARRGHFADAERISSTTRATSPRNGGVKTSESHAPQVQPEHLLRPVPRVLVGQKVKGRHPGRRPGASARRTGPGQDLWSRSCPGAPTTTRIPSHLRAHGEGGHLHLRAHRGVRGGGPGHQAGTRGDHPGHPQRRRGDVKRPRRVRHHPPGGQGRSRRHPGGQDHPQGRDPAHPRGKAP